MALYVRQVQGPGNCVLRVFYLCDLALERVQQCVGAPLYWYIVDGTQHCPLDHNWENTE